MTPRPTLLGASEQAVSDFARRRRWFVLPSFVACVALLARAVLGGGPWWIGLAIVVFAAVLCGTVFAAVIARDRSADRRHGSDFVFATFGRFAYADAVAQPTVGSSVAGVDRRRLDIACGLVEGTIAIGPSHLRFEPGQIATKAGATPIDWPWESIETIEIVPQRLSFGSGVRVRFRDGAALDFEVRGHGRLAAALKTALQET